VSLSKKAGAQHSLSPVKAESRSALFAERLASVV
jgi:hypothetical protein